MANGGNRTDKAQQTSQETAIQIDDDEIFPDSSILLRRKLSGADQVGIDIVSLDSLRLAQEASRIKFFSRHYIIQSVTSLRDGPSGGPVHVRLQRRHPRPLHLQIVESAQ